jgi:GTP-binding protein
MRREGYELAIGAPKVIYKEIDGKKAEPIEIMVIDAPTESSGKVIESVGQKKGELVKMEQKGNISKLEFHIPSRGLMGLRNKILTITAGEATMHHRFYQYEFFKGSIKQRQSGVLISMHEGSATAYAINSLQDRGKIFIDPGELVYAGQIVGEYNKDNDIEVHVQRGKKLTNIRAAGADKAAKIAPSRKFTLEECLEYIKDDELVEVTPKSIRMRKLYLDPNERKKYNKRNIN